MASYRRLLKLAGIAAAVLGVVLIVALAATQTAWFRDWVRRLIVRQSASFLNGQLEIERLDGSLFGGVELRGVTIRQDGVPVVTAESIAVDYDFWSVISRDVVIDGISLRRPTVVLRRESGGWNLGRLIKRQAAEEGQTGPGRALTLARVVIDNGRVVLQGIGLPIQAVEALQAQLRFVYRPVGFELTIDHVGFETRPDGLALRRLTGRLTLEGDDLHWTGIQAVTTRSDMRLDGVLTNHASSIPTVSATLGATRFVPAEFASLFPAVRDVEVESTLDVKAEGPLNALRIGFRTRSNAGDLSGAVALDATAPSRAITGTIDARRLNLAPVLGDPAVRTLITGRLTLDFQAPGSGLSAARGRFAFEGRETEIMGYAASDITAEGRLQASVLQLDGHARAYGADVNASGRLQLPLEGKAFSYALEGDVAGLDIRELPPSLGAPRFDSLIAGRFTLTGSPDGVDAGIRLRPSRLLGASLGEGTTAQVTMRGRRLEYSAGGSVAALDLRRVGAALGIVSLSGDRFASDLTGTFDVRGAGRGLADLELAARGTFTDSTLAGVRLPKAAVDATIQHRTLGAGIRADFARLDPGVLGVSQLQGADATGAADVTIRLADLGGELSLSDLAVAGAVTLGSSTLAGIAIDAADIGGRFENRRLELDRFALTGPALSASASGLLALDETTESGLEYRVESGDLTALGNAFGLSLAGQATIEGRATGNAQNLVLHGTITGAHLRYGTAVESLALDSTFSARLPEFDPSRVEAEARTTGESIRAAGIDIQRLTARTRYAQDELDVETTLEAGPRSLAASGRISIHEDHYETHLTALTLGMEGMTWSLPAGTQPVVRYGGQRLRIEDFVLENGPQRIAAAGELPLGEILQGRAATTSEAARLDLRVEHLQLSDVDRLMLGEHRFGGELDATASLRGTLAAPSGEAHFSIADGYLRRVSFVSLAGEVAADEHRIAVDLRLDQSPGHVFTARGEIPAAVLRTTPPGAAQPGGAESMDVHIQTTQLDLGVLNGITTMLLEVGGTAQADVHVIGTLADPRLRGTIAISNGAFTPAVTGAHYTGLDAQVRLEPDRVLVEQFRVLDRDGDPLTMQGALAVHEGTVGDVNVAVAATGFRLLDNELGNVDADVNLRLTGAVRQPRLDGEVVVRTGRLEADRILALATSGGSYLRKPEPTTITDAMIAELEQLPRRMAEEASRSVEPVPIATMGTSVATPSPASTVGTAAAPTSGNGGPQAAPGKTPEASLSALDALALDVRLRAADDLVVRGRDLQTASSPVSLGDVNVTLGGDLRVEKAANDTRGPAITGVVTVVRGFYDFQGRRFEVMRDSEVRFGGFRPMNPLLKIDAEREISGVVAQVHLRGSMRRPQLTLTSQPPLDPSDILSLIVFNAPINELGASDRASLTERAGVLAAGFVADPLTRSLGRALNLDYFQIRATGSRGEPSLGLGQQIGERLYVRFEQQFGADQISQLQFEYRLADFLRLVTSVAEGNQPTRATTRRVESQAVDLIFQWSY